MSTRGGRRRRAKMVAAVGIIPVSLDLLRRNEDVFPVFPAQRVDAPLDPPYLGRVAVGVVAASQHRIVRHVPTRIELLVEEQIPRRMTMCAILSGLVRLAPVINESGSVIAKRSLQQRFNAQPPDTELPNAADPVTGAYAA